MSGFGPRVPVSKADANLLERFAGALTRAMPAAGVRRVIVESVAFLFKNSIFPPAYVLGRLFFSRTVADASAMERIFANTDLDWTMVRPPELTDKPYRGKYRMQEGHLPRFGLKISRADVADLMIKHAEDHARTLLAGSDHQFVWASIAQICGLPGVPEWAGWFWTSLERIMP